MSMKITALCLPLSLLLLLPSSSAFSLSPSFLPRTALSSSSLRAAPRSFSLARPSTGPRTLLAPALRSTTMMAKDVTQANPQDVTVLVAGSTGYIGRFVTKELIARGYNVIAFSRSKAGVGGKKSEEDIKNDFKGATCAFGDVTDMQSLREKAFNGQKVDVVVSCLASRTGGVADSNLIDYQASKNCLDLLIENGGSHYVLLSAICVQKPLLEFQRAKLKLEEAITAQDSVSYSIVRPTAFFKSLAGQVGLVKDGKPYVMFGDGEICKANAISEQDLAEVMADCISVKDRHNKILPSEMLFEMFDREPKYIKVPIGVFDAIIGAIDFFANLFPNLKDTAEFARIGRYYATEDMVGPSYGKTTLREFFADVAENGLQGQELGDQAVFSIDGKADK